MAGAIAVIIALVVVIPVAVIMSGGILAAVMGTLLKVDAEKRNEGSELLDLNV